MLAVQVQALRQHLVSVYYLERHRLAGSPRKPIKALTQDQAEGQDHQAREVHECEVPIELTHPFKGVFDQFQDFQGIDAEQFLRR